MQRVQVLQKKRFLNQLYREWYEELAEQMPDEVDGPVVELGSGAGFIREAIPGIITSDVQTLPIVDVVLDGHVLPFQDQSLRAVLMVDVLHHMQDVERFFSEAQRCLKTNGVVAMIEPWVTPWSTFIYRFVHHEPFNERATNWRLPPGGALSQANSALPWLVFNKHRSKFRTMFPRLHISSIRLHTPFAYLISGGVRSISFAPGSGYPTIRKWEGVLETAMRHIAMFATVTLTYIGR